MYYNPNTKHTNQMTSSWQGAVLSVIAAVTASSPAFSSSFFLEFNSITENFNLRNYWYFMIYLYISFQPKAPK